jgi:hypothetical protein
MPIERHTARDLRPARGSAIQAPSSCSLLGLFDRAAIISGPSRNARSSFEPIYIWRSLLVPAAAGYVTHGKS